MRRLEAVEFLHVVASVGKQRLEIADGIVGFIRHGCYEKTKMSCGTMQNGNSPGQKAVIMLVDIRT